jgi:hypothetical protein
MDRMLLVRPFMKRLILLTSYTLLLYSSGCDSKFIDDIFTFNVEKSFEFTIPAGTPAGRLPTALTLPLLINDSVLSANGTSMNLLKSAKLTKLQLTFVPTTFTLANIDTLDFRIKSNNQPLTSLAYYSNGLDSIRLTNVDFAPHIKDTGAEVTADVGINTATTEDIKTTVTYTLSITAHPF